MLKLISGASALLALSSSAVYAVSETGSGQPQLQFTLDGNQAVVQMSQNGVTALGRVNLEQGYGQAVLDAITDGSLQAGWGRVEVLNGCGTADVIVYQTIDGEDVETLVGLVTTGACE